MRSKAIQEEAARLLRDYGTNAYENAREAMRLARVKKNARLESYFAKVAQLVARDSGREVGVDTATRYLYPNNPDRRKNDSTTEGETMRRLLVGTLFIANFVPLRAHAWWDEGHMQVAAVAYERLTPAVRAKVDALIKLNPQYPSWASG